jgi:hypothetical protein
MATNQAFEGFGPRIQLLAPASTTIASGAALLFGKGTKAIACVAETAASTALPAYDSNSGYITVQTTGAVNVSVKGQTQSSPSAGAAINRGDAVYADGGSYDATSGITTGSTLDGDSNGTFFGIALDPGCGVGHDHNPRSAQERTLLRRNRTMTPFMDVVRNWGDFPMSSVAPSGVRSGPALTAREANMSGSSEQFGGYSGQYAYTDQEPGFRRKPWQEAQQFSGVRKRMYESDLMAATRLLKQAFDGDDYARIGLKRAMRGGMREALSISDFPNLFGDIIDRAVLANYLETPYTWNMIANASDVNDFRPVKRFIVNGGTGLLAGTSAGIANVDSAGALTPLEAGAQYPEDSLTDGAYSYRMFKVGKRMPFFWETFVDDDLNALKDTPARFGRGARRTEEYFVTWLFANGVSSILQQGTTVSALYSNTNKNIVNNTNVGDSGGNNPVLSITALQRAIVCMMKQVDSTGQPISIEAMTLVVPPSLKTVAMNILNTDYVWMSDQGGTQQVNGANLSATVAQQLHALNWAKNIVRLAVNYYLPIVDTTYGNTGWYLFSNPENGRPAWNSGDCAVTRHRSCL